MIRRKVFMLIHHANYTVISDPTAPFGVRQIWETDGVSIEDSGPYDPNDKNCDGPGTISRGNSQIGIGAVSRVKTLTTESRRNVTPAIPGFSTIPEILFLSKPSVWRSIRR